jgi:hypothetical protein
MHVYDPQQIGAIILHQFLSTANDTHSVTLVDGNNVPTDNISLAMGCRYSDCVRFSNQTTGWQLLTWNQFAPMFSAWLLPWLALTAQLPFETRGPATNIMSLLMALGSPLLAGYSLALMVLNARWINGTFRRLREQGRNLHPKRPEHYDALSVIRWILIEIQHVPIKFVHGLNYDFAQMIGRPENAATWKKFGKEIFKTKREKTLSLFTQLAWVIVAQVLSICQFFTTGADDDSVVLGLAVNALWAWMLPVVWGWVFVGTQVRARYIRDAIDTIRPSRITLVNPLSTFDSQVPTLTENGFQQDESFNDDENGIPLQKMGSRSRSRR